ncbi:MAG: 3-isopropylmalate dehydrogenase [Candidatus Gracilibacteria bacterium]|jgi:3-isopropylmalate dehydrogenase
MKYKIAVLSGDGIGPEIMIEAMNVLKKIESKFGHQFEFKEALIGGAAWDVYKDHFPEDTKTICKNSDAILFGSVGGPVSNSTEEKWHNCEINSILGIRKFFNFNINLRPSKSYKSLINSSYLRADIVQKGIDMLCVRELSQDVYFGEHKTYEKDGMRIASDVMIYDEKCIEEAAHAAFKAAMKRQKKVHSVDKANVLDCSKLWRDVVSKVAKNYPECELNHILVDNCAMQVIKRPYDFDVLLLPNMFGDIISDETSVFSGSLGMLASASLNSDGFGLYEPSSGSAPDIAGKGIANPIGQILSAAMMLKYSFNLNDEHDTIVNAVEKTLDKGCFTADISPDNTKSISTSKMGNAIINNI